MKLSNYNMQVVENAVKGLRGKGVRFKVLKQINDVQMVWRIEKDSVQKLVMFYEGKIVAHIPA